MNNITTVFLTACLVISSICVWFIFSYFEARVFNRYSEGAYITAVEAMFVNLSIVSE